MDHVISGPCYEGTILQRNYRKITIYSLIKFVKFHAEKIWEPMYVLDCYNSKVTS